MRTMGWICYLGHEIMQNFGTRTSNMVNSVAGNQTAKAKNYYKKRPGGQLETKESWYKLRKELLPIIKTYNIMFYDISQAIGMNATMVAEIFTMQKRYASLENAEKIKDFIYSVVDAS